eukprot:TRINITY_DN7108_c0_g1_i1.p1 TRINITY_DN7108_c0_g1~~TRINITY_DN7108_c0_g1_i1.p1  ORF type:complete len:410 (+),score=84.50 TRINITY_DN7108_c0_g1_i1:67-1296(+)
MARYADRSELWYTGDRTFHGRWVTAEDALRVLEVAKKASRGGWLRPEVVRAYVAPFFQAATREMPVVVDLGRGTKVWALDDRSSKDKFNWIPLGEGPHDTPGVRHSGCACIPNRGQILVSGGSIQTHGRPISEKVWALDTSGSGRPAAELPPMRVSRTSHACATFATGVLVAGGQTPGGVTSQCEWWDPAKEQWQPMPPLSRPRARAAACNVGGAVVVAGGHDSNHKLIREVEALAPGASEWVTIAALTYPRLYPACAAGVHDGAPAAVISGGHYRGRASAAAEAVSLPAVHSSGAILAPADVPAAKALPLLPVAMWGGAGAGSANGAGGVWVFGGDPSDSPLPPFIFYLGGRAKKWAFAWAIHGPVPPFASTPRSGMAAAVCDVLPPHWVWCRGRLRMCRGTEMTSDD